MDFFMGDNAELIRTFYTSFQRLDWRGMVGCYAEDVFFCDPVFQNLEGEQARGMWEMLCKSAKDFQVSFSEITLDEDYGSCQWTAQYTFSQTGRRVVNHVKAHFKFADGKIVEHQDMFNLWNWSRQALGFTGLLLGATSFMHNKIRRMARKSLDKFLAARASNSNA
jgi:ketosteroid isomerase-like protein